MTDAIHDTDPAPTTPTAPDRRTAVLPLSIAGRGILAVLSLAAATIHFVMVPQHAVGWLPEGLAFAASGWFQIGFAVAIIARPTRAWLTIGVVANLVFIAAWALTRTVGMPFGPEAGLVENAQLIDLTCVGIEAALVLAASSLSLRPRLGENLDSAKLVAASIVPVAILTITTAALAAPSTANHSHGGSESAAGHDHSGDAHDPTGAHDAGSHDATAVAVPAASRCDWTMNTVAFWNQNPPAAADTAHDHMGGSSSESASGSAAVGNHHGVQAWRPLTDPAECAKLQADLDTMEGMAKTYPTLQSALDAGCGRVTGYVPGIATHIICYRNLTNPLDVTAPEMLLYGGDKPWAPMVGLSYYSMTPVPTGNAWADGQMPFHIHDGLCIKGGLVIGGDGSTKEVCESQGGHVLGKTGSMGHYWLPSCPSPDGVFSADNPRLDIGVATYNDDPKWDPANGGDPTKLQANPCTGSKMQPSADDRFGAPSSGTSENAAGVPANK